MWLLEPLCTCDWLCSVKLQLMFAASAVWLSGCASHACWTLDVVSVTGRTPRRSSPPPVCQSIRPPLSKQHGAGESQDAFTFRMQTMSRRCTVFRVLVKSNCLVWWCTLKQFHHVWMESRVKFLYIEIHNKNLPLPDVPTPAWWEIRPTGPTTTVPPPSPGWFYWLWCSTWLPLLQVRDQTSVVFLSEIDYNVQYVIQLLSLGVVTLVLLLSHLSFSHAKMF